MLVAVAPIAALPGGIGGSQITEAFGFVIEVAEAAAATETAADSDARGDKG